MDVGGDDDSGDEDGGGVEQDNIAAGAGLAGEYGAQDRGVGDGIASAQRFKRRGVQADLLRPELVEGHGVAVDFGELRRAGDGELVQSRFRAA